MSRVTWQDYKNIVEGAEIPVILGPGRGFGRGYGPGMGPGRGLGPGLGYGPGRGMYGPGRGMYGPGFGMGLGGQCICPSCGYTSDHIRGMPCIGMPCPECGVKMVRNVNPVENELKTAELTLDQRIKKVEETIKAVKAKAVEDYKICFSNIREIMEGVEKNYPDLRKYYPRKIEITRHRLGIEKYSDEADEIYDKLADIFREYDDIENSKDKIGTESEPILEDDLRAFEQDSSEFLKEKRTNKKAKSSFGGDVLIEISGMDVPLKNGEIDRKACAPKIRIYGKDDNGEYTQAGLIQKLALMADAGSMTPVFEVTYPEHPLFSDTVKKAIERSSKMLRRAGADIKIEVSGEITERLDRIATELEQAGRPDMALALDQVSDRFEKRAENAKKTVGINDFVKRQAKEDFVGTKVTMSDIERLRTEAEKQVNAGTDKKGYADFVRIVSVNDPSILCPIAKITDDNKKFLKTEKTKRREGEEEYEHSFFLSKDVKGIPSHHVDVILYTREQLEKEKEKNTGSDLDMISINAQFSEKGAPITPETMRRNIKGPEFGGSGFQHSKDEISESEKFWNQYAMIK